MALLLALTLAGGAPLAAAIDTTTTRPLALPNPGAAGAGLGPAVTAPRPSAMLPTNPNRLYRDDAYYPYRRSRVQNGMITTDYYYWNSPGPSYPNGYYYNGYNSPSWQDIQNAKNPNSRANQFLRYQQKQSR